MVLHNGPLGMVQRYWAALLHAAGRDDPSNGRWPGALITGTAALALNRLHAAPAPEDVRAIDVLVPVPRNVPSRGQARVLRTRRMPRPPRWMDGRLPTAPPVRAVADAVRQGSACAEAALYEVVQTGRVSPKAMAAELRAERLAGRGWVRETLDDLRAGTRSPAEARARRLIDGTADVPEPLWNARLLLDGEWLADPDAYWPAHGVVVEVDSLRHHLGLADHQRTMARRNRITRTGLMVLAATPAMLRDHPGRVLDDLRTLLAGGPYGPWRRVAARPARTA